MSISLTYVVDFGQGYVLYIPAGALESCIAEREAPMTTEENGLGEIQKDGNASSATLSSNSDYDNLNDLLAEGLHTRITSHQIKPSSMTLQTSSYLRRWTMQPTTMIQSCITGLIPISTSL